MPNAKILLVEDERMLVDLLQSSLEPLGYKVVAKASSGEEALQLVAEASPDLILMDIQLCGEIDGVETAVQLRQQYDIPVVYLTGHVDDKLLERVKATGPFGYVLKPFKEKELHTALEIALYRHHMETKMRRLNDELEQRVEERAEVLQKTNQALKHTVEAFSSSMTQLAQAEKMAGLGGLVAGMTHDMSSPLGISVMALSHLEEQTRKTREQFVIGKLTRKELEKYFNTAEESIAILDKNLSRTTELLNSFKQIAIDQTSDQKRLFTLSEYFDDILLSLQPALKNSKHAVEIDCPEGLSIYSYPGAFSQILTNLAMNSLIHGFEDLETGIIQIQVNIDVDTFVFLYQDNGKGIPKEHSEKIFEPFFTTKREQGSSGLGLHIVHNLVTETFRGTINCESSAGQGTSFSIRIPMQELKET